LLIVQHKGIGTIKLRNRRRSEKDVSHPSSAGSGAYTIGALTSQSAAVVASMAAGKTMMPTDQALMDVNDDDDDDDDAASLGDDGLSSSSSDEDGDADSADEGEALAESPDATPLAGDSVPRPKGHAAQWHGQDTKTKAKRRSTDQSASSVDSSDVSTTAAGTAPAHGLVHRSSGYFDRMRRESSPQDLTVPCTPGVAGVAGTASGATTPGGSKRPFFLRGRGSKASSASLVDATMAAGGGTATPKDMEKKAKGKGKGKGKKRNKKNFNFDADHGKDILGIVVLEIQKAEDLPRIRSSKSSLAYSRSLDRS
jgi:phosphatidylserine decarboxylase